MTATPSFRATGSNSRFRVTAEVPDAAAHEPRVVLTVEDQSAGLVVHLDRGELMPLLKVIREAVKSVDDALSNLPKDPVERAAYRVVARRKYAGWARALIMKDYAKELDGLRARYVQRIDEWAERDRNPPSAEDVKPPVPEGGWDLTQ